MDSILKNNISEQAKEDIRELDKKIRLFDEGKIDEERFKAFRLTRGVYGQRQQGVQMFRLKLPYGKLTTLQLNRIADISDKYSTGNLHTTTRQNIQLHYVKLKDSPEIWTLLEDAGITAREACGNTVRNVTGSSLAGIDPEEPFDITPYAEEVFRFFLRNPICQEMGRKIKIAFSSSEKDSAFTYFHDFGFIPKVKNVGDRKVRGFKVVIGGGLGAQSMVAQTAFDFLEEDQIIPFTESAIRVFDRYGEREKRFKARLKFLIDERKGIGLDKFLALVEIEKKSIASQTYKIDQKLLPDTEVPEEKIIPEVKVENKAKYDDWLKTNIFAQKQEGFYAVSIKLLNGNIDSDTARKLTAIVKKFAADDIRVTVNQGLMLKFVRKNALPALFQALDTLKLAEPGFGTIADITTCPGTDTCNLGVTNSTGLAVALEKVIQDEFKDLIYEADINIKISGCMNSCGQHMAANIGFHGSSIKNDPLVAPALVLLLGGGVDPDGKGFIAHKVAKIPTKRAPEALRIILSDYQQNAVEGQYFNDYYKEKGKIYFYDKVKHLAEVSKFEKSDYIDWGSKESFIPEIGVGECAGVSYDVIGTIIGDAQERLTHAKKALKKNQFPESIYFAYSTLTIGAKALLLSEDIRCNTHIGIIKDFDKYFVETKKVSFHGSFEKAVLKINQNEPEEKFAREYVDFADNFLNAVVLFRSKQISGNSSANEKVVISNFYKA